MPKHSIALAHDVFRTDERIYVTEAWRRDINRAAQRQWRAELRDPLRLLETLVADEFDGVYQLSCGSPMLIFSPKYAARVCRIAGSHLVLLERKLELGVTPCIAAQLERDILLTDIVMLIFEDVVRNNTEEKP